VARQLDHDHAGLARSTRPRGRPRRRWGSVHADTDRTGYDTGAFASTGVFVAGKGVRLAAEALSDRILTFAAAHAGVPLASCRLVQDAVVCDGAAIDLADLHAAAERAGTQLAVARRAYASPRSVAFNVQGFRIAVHRVTGEIKILQSVHAADAGMVINPVQCLGQVEGSIAQALGWALTEQMAISDDGRVTNPSFRNYRIPAFADIPRSEVHFARTHDAYGPDGAKGMGECPVNPVAPALANALEDATGIRFRELPLTPDRIYQRIFERKEASTSSLPVRA